MSGGARYWNEETQRWEDGDGSGTSSTPVTPPPARPGFAPEWPPGVGPGPASAGPPSGSPPAPPVSTPDGSSAPPVSTPDGSSSPPVSTPDGSSSPPVSTPDGSSSPPVSTPDGSSSPPVSTPDGSSFPPVSTPDGSSFPPPVPPAGLAGAASQGDGVAEGVGGHGGVVGWPGAGEGSAAWHGPGAAGGPAGTWSVPEHVGAGAGAGPGVASPDEWPGAVTGTSWPAVDPQSAPPAPAGGMSRRLVWSVVVGAAVVGVAVSLVLTLVVGGGDEGDEPSAATSPSAEAEAGGSQPSDPSDPSDPFASSPEPSFTEETASPSASVPVLPVGYELYEDEEGFRIARPAGWTRSSVDSQYGMAVVNYRSPDGERRLQVYQVAEGSPEESFELFLSDETPKAPGFEQLDLQTLDDGEFTGTRLEYRADSLKGEPDVGPWHVYDERFVAEDGNIYAIAAYGLDADGPEDELQLLTTAVEAFCPPYACEPASID
ncbi:hypothetical protein OG800_20690 [Streptomyces sp. NBC_00445]|uniref:hypothetical protein n=1 Tax=Streptomyces sp. NBC_00445 TaxID=2975745 RepID=UPI002E1C0694